MNALQGQASTPEQRNTIYSDADMPAHMRPMAEYLRAAVVTEAEKRLLRADVAARANMTEDIVAVPCSSAPGDGAASWAVDPVTGGGAPAGAVALRSLAPAGGCVGLNATLGRLAQLYLSIRVANFTQRDTQPNGYNFVLFQSRDGPAQHAQWELRAGGRLLRAGILGTPLLPGQWASVALTAVGANITAVVDGAAVVSVQDATFGWGMVALGSGWHPAWWDSVSVAAAA